MAEEVKPQSPEESSVAEQAQADQVEAEKVAGEKVEAQKTAASDLASLGSSALKGTIWSIGTYAVAMIFRLASNIVLTRMLVPQYFGLLTLLNTTITGLTLLSDLGIIQNIVRSKRGDEPAFLNTAWTMQVIRGGILWVVCVLLSYPFARFYNQPDLGLLVPVIGLSVVIAGFNSTSLSTLYRHMEVRKMGLMELGIQAIQLILTIVWAYFDPSIWALVGGRLISDVVRLVVSHRMIPGQRNRICWEKQSVRELFTFGRWIFFSTALTFIATQADRMIIGKLVSLQSLGLYGVAYNLADVPRQVINTFCGYVVLPFVSRLSHLPRDEFFKHVLKFRFRILMGAAVILSLVVATGDLFMLRIYDSRYHAATWIVTILAIGLWHTILYSTTSPCLLAIGKPYFAVIGNLFSSAVILVLVPLAFSQWGLPGAVWAVALCDLPMYFVIQYGLVKDKMFSAWQDLEATCVFLICLGLFLGVRYLAGVPFPTPVLLN